MDSRSICNDQLTWPSSKAYTDTGRQNTMCLEACESVRHGETSDILSVGFNYKLFTGAGLNTKGYFGVP